MQTDINELISTVCEAIDYLKSDLGNNSFLVDDINNAVSLIASQTGNDTEILIRGKPDIDTLHRLETWLQQIKLNDVSKPDKIPKVLHYCWFGKGEKHEKIIRCMETWRKHLPEYEIVEWNETNCDISRSKYAKSAYALERWAFVADYFRFKILSEHGGIYLDTDIFMNKPLDDYLKYDTFFAMECYKIVNGAIIGATNGCRVIEKIFDLYSDRAYEIGNETVGKNITEILIRNYNYQTSGFTQILDENIAVLSPNIMTVDVGDGMNICEHLYDPNPSWWSEEAKKAAKGGSWKYVVLQRYFYNLFGRPGQNT